MYGDQIEGKRPVGRPRNTLLENGEAYMAELLTENTSITGGNGGGM